MKCIYIGNLGLSMPIGILDILNKELGLWFEYDKHNELLQVFKDNVEVCNC